MLLNYITTGVNFSSKSQCIHKKEAHSTPLPLKELFGLTSTVLAYRDLQMTISGKQRSVNTMIQLFGKIKLLFLVKIYFKQSNV